MGNSSKRSLLRQRGVLSLFLLFMPVMLMAQDVINVFKIGGDVCPPVTLKTSKGTYTINSSITINGSLSWFEAYDCRNRHIVNPAASTSVRSGQPTVRTYILKTLYNDSSSGTSGNTNTYRREVQENTANVVGNTVSNLGSSMGRMAYTGMQYSAVGYPNLTLNVGASRMYGEFARLKACLGGAGGLLLYGGVGKDWIFNSDNKDKLSWHSGLGYYGIWGDDDEQEFNFGITFSETVVCPGYALSMDLSYNYYFGDSTRFGVFGGLGLGIGNLKEAFKTEEGEKFGGKFVWDITLGIAVKLFAGD